MEENFTPEEKLDVLIEWYKDKKKGATIPQINENLFDGGYLDSVDVIEMITVVEELIERPLTETEIQPQKFCSFNAIFKAFFVQ